MDLGAIQQQRGVCSLKILNGVVRLRFILVWRLRALYVIFDSSKYVLNCFKGTTGTRILCTPLYLLLLLHRGTIIQPNNILLQAPLVEPEHQRHLHQLLIRLSNLRSQFERISLILGFGKT